MPVDKKKPKNISGNWSRDRESNARDKAALAAIKETRKGKKYKLIKILDMPATWKEIEIK